MPPFAQPKSEIQRLIEAEAVRQGLSPALLVAIATQESWLNPNAVGDRGKSLGLFQLQRAAAIDAGIDPNRRGELGENIRGGVSYFKQQLRKEGGNVERALSRYNRGTPTYQGIGDPNYVENVLSKVQGGARSQMTQSQAPAAPAAPPRSLASRVTGMLSPRSAEAAAPAPADARQRLEAITRRLEGIPAATPQAPETTETRLEAINRRLATLPPSPTPPSSTPAAPAPSPAPSLRSQVQQVFAPPQPEQIGPTTDVAQWLPGFEWLNVLPRRAQEAAVAQTPEVARQALATGLSTTAEVAGTALAGPVGGVLGSGAGYGLNVALGLEEPSLTGAALSVGIPAATAAAAPVTKAVIRKLPGASSAMHQEVAERLGAMKGRLQPPVPSASLYEQAAVDNPPIRASAVAREATDVLAREMALEPSLRNPRLVRVARDLQTLTQAGEVPMQQLYANQQRVGELVRDFRSKGGVGEGRIKQLYAAFHEDLETAAGKGVPGAQVLKDAIAASRKEHVAQEIDDLFQPGQGGITLDPEGRASINGGRLASAWKAKLRRDTVLAKTLDAQEKAEIDDIMTLSQRLERLRPPRGMQFGSGRSLARGTVATGIAAVTGMNPFVAGAVAMNAPELIAKAMQTSPGRAMVKKALQEGKGRIDHTALAAMAALVRQQLGEPVPETGAGVQPGQQVQVEPGRILRPMQP